MPRGPAEADPAVLNPRGLAGLPGGAVGPGAINAWSALGRGWQGASQATGRTQAAGPDDGRAAQVQTAAPVPQLGGSARRHSEQARAIPQGSAKPTAPAAPFGRLLEGAVGPPPRTRGWHVSGDGALPAEAGEDGARAVPHGPASARAAERVWLSARPNTPTPPTQPSDALGRGTARDAATPVPALSAMTAKLP